VHHAMWGKLNSVGKAQVCQLSAKLSFFSLAAAKIGQLSAYDDHIKVVARSVPAVICSLFCAVVVVYLP
jgi:hypothetical protein